MSSAEKKISEEQAPPAVATDDQKVAYAKRERRFLWKLDIILITWAWISYTIRVSGNLRHFDDGRMLTSSAHRWQQLQDCIR